ncbi:MAG: hypothetical protein WDW36_007207 [Sanguina aurantia]
MTSADQNDTPTHPAVHLRRAKLSDLACIVDFNQKMAKETEDLDLPLSVVQGGVSAVLDASRPACYFVLEDHGVVAAQLMITYEWSDWRCANIWWIQSVYVVPEHRKKGYFRELYAYVKQEALASKACGLRLYADNGNTRAHMAYEKLGMSSHYKVYEDMFTEY